MVPRFACSPREFFHLFTNAYDAVFDRMGEGN